MTTNQIVEQVALTIGRRELVRRGLATSFAVFTGLSVGRLQAKAVACCTGPFSSGACPSSLCSGYACSNNEFYSCSFTWCCCFEGLACWQSSCGGTCCDCQCSSISHSFYCYCHG